MEPSEVPEQVGGMVIKEEPGLEDETESSYINYIHPDVCLDNQESSNSPMDDMDDDNIIMIRMDIKEPLCTIKAILEERFGDVSDYTFTLQDSEELDGRTNLLDHCVQGEGLVQINLEIKDDSRGKRLDIIDVLKPDDEEDDYPDDDDENNQSNKAAVGEKRSVNERLRDDVQLDSPEPLPEKKIKRKGNQKTRRDSAAAPARKTSKGALDASLTFSPEIESIPSGEVILPKPKKPRPKKKKPAPTKVAVKKEKVKKPASPKTKTTSKLVHSPKVLATSQSLHLGQSSSSSIQLWQFLLELLTDHQHRKSIQWLSREGEFELLEPEMVAKLWGLKKNKTNMNYEKLSRALRFYYDGDMLTKVPGKKFVYKFICDLKFLIGYTAKELNEFVVEAEALAQRNSIHYLSEYPKSPPSSPETVIQQGVVVPSNYCLQD